jgi:hypothetical protein
MDFNRIEKLIHELTVKGHIGLRDGMAIVAAVNFVGEHNPASFQLEYGKMLYDQVLSLTNQTAEVKS